MEQKKYLITGAAGFVGRHLLNSLNASPGVRSIALIRDKKNWQEMEWTQTLHSVTVIAGSVTEPKKWQEDSALTSLNGIFHLAAVIRHSRKNPQDMYRTNVEGLTNMVRLAAVHRCRIVFLSTSGTVGCFQDPKQKADEEAPYCEDEVASWPYYDSKIQAERKAIQLANELKVELVILRPPVLLGPGDHRHRATGHILRLMQGRLPFILKGGIHFVDVRDAADAILKAMEKPHPKPIYHLAGTECSIPEFFNMVGEIAGVAPPKLQLPPYLAKVVAGAASQLEALLPKRKSPLLPDPVVFEMAAKYWGVRSRYSEADLDYRPRDPRDTIRDTVQWLKRNSF